MVKTTVTILIVLGVSLGLVFFAGCESEAQTGGLIGSGIGAGVGQAIGGDTQSTILGGVAGGALGYAIGNEGDKKKERARTQAEIDALRAEQNTVTIWVTNSNGSRTPVTLRRSGPNYIGPGGEYYTSMPTEEQLKQRYGR